MRAPLSVAVHRGGRLMRTQLAVLLACAVAAACADDPSVGRAQQSVKEVFTSPAKSAFYDLQDVVGEFELGLGNVSKLSCSVGAASQPAVYAGNMLLDCDAEVPHNETTIAIDPTDGSHAVGGYHSYQLTATGNTVHLHIIGVASVTRDGGDTWQEAVPPITPYQFTGDPALAFDANGRLYYANIADNEGQGGGNFTGPDVVVARSQDGGLTWSHPVQVAAGLGNAGSNGQLVFNDKDFIAVDTSATSVHQNRVYVTWTRFEESGTSAFFRSPIMVSHSDDGVSWSAGKEISGFNSACAVQFGGGPAGECDEDQDSYPTVAPGGRVYASFENFNTPAENQLMVVSSGDGGDTWSAPVRVSAVFDINFPT